MCGVFDKCDQDSVMIPSIYKKKETVKIERPRNDLCVLLCDRPQIR